MNLSDKEQKRIFKRTLTIILYNNLPKRKKIFKKRIIKNKEKKSLAQLFEEVNSLEFKCGEEKNHKFIFKNITKRLQDREDLINFRRRYEKEIKNSVRKEYLRQLMRQQEFYQPFMEELKSFIENKKYQDQQIDKIERQIEEAMNPNKKKREKRKMRKYGVDFYLENETHHFHLDREIKFFAVQFLRLIFTDKRPKEPKPLEEYTENDYQYIPGYNNQEQ